MAHDCGGGCSDHIPEIDTATEGGKAHLTVLPESQTDSKNEANASVRGFYRRAFADILQRRPEGAQSSG